MRVKVNARLESLSNYYLEHFQHVEVALTYGSIASAFKFAAYFNPDNPQHKEIFHPGHIHIATIEDEGEKLMTGYVYNTPFRDDTKTNAALISGTSLCGALELCQIPKSLYPLQSDGLSLREIAQKYIEPFAFGMVVDPSVNTEMDKPYDTVTAEATQTIKGFLTELCVQRNILMTHDINGNLLFTKPKRKAPVLTIDGNQFPKLKMGLDFNATGMSSDITVVKEPDFDFSGSNVSETVNNPFINYVFLPRVITQTTGDDGDTATFANMALKEQLKNISFTLEMPDWRIGGVRIKPGDFINVRNPKVYLYDKTDLFVESVTYTQTHSEKKCIVKLVLPFVYLDEPIKSPFPQ